MIVQTKDAYYNRIKRFDRLLAWMLEIAFWVSFSVGCYKVKDSFKFEAFFRTLNSADILLHDEFSSISISLNGLLRYAIRIVGHLRCVVACAYFSPNPSISCLDFYLLYANLASCLVSICLCGRAITAWISRFLYWRFFFLFSCKCITSPSHNLFSSWFISIKKYNSARNEQRSTDVRSLRGCKFTPLRW